MTRLLLILAAIGLVGYGVFFALFGSTSYSWHQRLTVVVDTPMGQVRGAAVTAVSVTEYHGAINLPNGGHGSWDMHGEAVVVEVLPGRYLFALLNGGDNPNGAAAAWTGTTFKQRDFPNENGISFDDLRAIIRSEPRDTPIPLPPQAMPLLVTFDDITDPTTVRLVDPTNLSASFGPGVSLAGVTLEITEADVTKGRVEGVLGWLHSILPNQLDGQRYETITATNRFANSISPYLFSTELNK
jgi:hypothetical protein